MPHLIDYKYPDIIHLLKSLVYENPGRVSVFAHTVVTFFSRSSDSRAHGVSPTKSATDGRKSLSYSPFRHHCI